MAVFIVLWPYLLTTKLEIVGEWVLKRRPFWIKILHILPILLGRFCDKKSWKLLSVLCSLWGIYAWENLQCVFSLQTLQCAMFWFSLKLAYSDLSIKRTGCNKRTGWSKNLIYYMKKKFRVVKNFKIVKRSCSLNRYYRVVNII